MMKCNFFTPYFIFYMLKKCQIFNFFPIFNKIYCNDLVLNKSMLRQSMENNLTFYYFEPKLAKIQNVCLVVRS